MITTILLDAGPLGLAASPALTAETIASQNWIASQDLAGRRILVPEIADYEVRRELLLRRAVVSVRKLDVFISTEPDRYLAITTVAMRRAANLWAQSRLVGAPTADRHALGGDVVLAAQALTLGVPLSDLVVVTTNVAHLSRYVPAARWQDIAP